MPPFPTLRALLAGFAALVAACASRPTSSVYVHPRADLSSYQRVAVLPLGNLTSDRYAGERVREVIGVELAALGAFEVTEIGTVDRVLREQNIGVVTEMTPEQIATLGELLDVQVLLHGQVMEYRERRTGTFTAPEIALSLHLVDVESGVEVWSVTDSQTGIDLRTRLFGVGEKTQSTVARDLVRRVVLELFDLAGA